MNLWDKALKMGLVILVPSLFFLACEEELNNVGTDTSGNQFDLLYKEFTLPSHVIIDSVKTSEVGLLTGSYVDPEFGTVTSESYSAFAAVSSVNLSGNNIVFDKLEFALKFSPYYYGENTETSITFKIHELTEEVTDASSRTNFSTIMYDATPLGEGSFVLQPEKYDTLELSETDTLKIMLDDLYLQRIQDTLGLTKTVDGEVTNKYTTNDISSETGFYGFAILASNSDKVVGISTGSQLSFQYHTLENGVHKDTLEYSYSLSTERFNKITSDRSGTALADVKDENPSSPFLPSNGLRYIQSGTGVTTEIDFQAFIDSFKDTPNVIFNSVSLSFGEIESTQNFKAPTGLILNQTNENSEEASIDINGEPLSSVLSDAGGQEFFPLNVLEEEENTGVYFNLPTAYFQLLKDTQVERSTAILKSALSSGIEIGGYTVDRFIVHQDSIKLKVYYTLPK